MARPDNLARRPAPQMVTAVQQQVTLREGPLPSPADFAAYNAVLPNAAERIMAMAEREMVQRHAQENATRSAETRMAARAQGFAFIIALAVILGSILAILQDKSLAGLSALIAVLATLAGVFVVGRRKQSP